ncbi:MAG: response regulator [Ramlibacter sp.]
MNSTISVERPPAVMDGTVNILIVDDEPKNLVVLETVLDDPGYRLVRAGSGEEALLALMAQEFAVLVLDVRMPGMTGFELAQMIKERKKTARVPIIFLTAYYNEDQHILEGYGSGAVDYLHKPVNAAVLRSKVAVFAELHRKGRALEVANRALLAEVAERRRAESRLSELNQSLDRRVTERTEELQASEAQLRRANERKDEFLATLAHELRNPLAPVRNAVEILRRKGLATPELKWAMGLIDRQLQAMTRLIDDLMDVSRINQGKIELRRERVELASVIQDAIEATRPLIDELGHELVLDLPPDSLVMDADATRLAQAFMNLLNNAAKYMDRGGRIEVTARQSEGELVATVSDGGIGIAGDRLEAVFEMFSQVETALSRSRGGLGIGLSLTQRLVEMHGGKVKAVSDGLGRGSRFEVRLPLAAPKAVAVGGADQGGTAKHPPGMEGGQLRILVADDNQDAAATMTVLLEMLGHTVRSVHDGQAAVEAAAEFHPEVVLLDIGMPRLNGFEACRMIRAQPGGGAMKVVAITGWGQPGDRIASQEAGFDQHMVKPVDPVQLTKLLAAVAAERS